ncbi:replicative DNA helicase [Acinetobacter radioresistens]|jgi:replicative DNA helicase|uniref:Replicative DNA helicase n=2 Tax=Acinetobacter radioresistens TaxID=40216 RepID=A0A2T1IZR1_ACIRA|nr:MULTISPECIES: replicative DNA helicase [Acinetobacter]AWV85947.1 replicative DNA helicase [Acinetobacter radioresistens]EET82640.1 replicative DNA helicase [Acinetobacter radioresistens SK82]EEY87676.1 replicative DNA helicase [Acinetobacter radioresistens SH164]EJO37511.1 replicative DNA helicase [Acinetobacter radioresistens WC-A-157]ENV88001.1 replicative DNA helicase [Acinetobacter radioresistens NIPH 2130]
MSQASAKAILNPTLLENKATETAQLKEFRTPPHNLAIEQAVLAALMTVAESFEQVGDVLKENDFYATRHKYIFRAIEKLAQENSPYDAVLVNDWLLKQNLIDAVGGEEYLMQLMADSPSSFYNLETYAAKIKEFATLRNMIKISTEILQNAYDTKGRSVSEILDLAETNIFSIAEQHNNNKKDSGPKSISTVTAEVITKLDELSKLEGSLTGLSTGFIELDNKTYGMQSGDLIIVAARPSMGKTTFAMNLVESVLFNCNLPALVFSMEMPADSIAMRLISSYGKVHQGHLRSGKLDGDEWSKVTGTILQLQEKHLYIDDSSALPPTELRARARRIAKQHGGKLGCIMVDYLQLMKVPGMGDNRVGEISEISRSLKALAKEMQCPVIALSQLNRSLENRPNKRPVMSDLRESGAIEQDADLIMFIYRDEVYNKESKEAGTAEIIIGKQRNGPIGSVRLAFEGQYTRFSNLSPEYYNQFDDEE